MKKIVSLFIFFIAMMALASCGESDQKTLKLGFDAEYPPFGYLDETTLEYTGFDIDYAKAVCEKIGYKLELIPINWDAKDQELTTGSIDCIWSGFTINGRENDYLWTDAYVDNSIVVLTKKTAGINTLEDLKNKTVTVQMDSSAQAALDDNLELVKTFKGEKYLLCADYTTAYMELKSGAIDAIAIDINVAKFLMQNEASDYVILQEQISSEQYGVGFRKTDTALRDLVNKAMNDLAKDGTVVTIAKKYGIEDAICIGK